MDYFYLFVPFLRIVLGLFFMVSGALKFPNLKKFSVIVASYGVLPRKFVKPLAYAQPFIEFLIGFWVLSGFYLFFAAIAGLIMMLVADFFVLFALLNKKKIDNCGCYGVAVKVPLSWNKFAKNIFWILLFAVLAVLAL